MRSTMRRLIEYGLFCTYKNPVTKLLIASPSILAFLLWCYTAFNGYRDIQQLAKSSATYCLYGNYMYYIARFGIIISVIFILMAALPFFMDRQANGGMILKTLPVSSSKQNIVRFIQEIMLSLTSLLMILFTIMTAICITDMLFPELSLSLYDRRLQFLEYGIRLIVNMEGIVLIQASAHFITRSIYVPIAFGCIMAFFTEGIYNPFFTMLNCFDGNVPLF